ncbi:MAG: N-acetylmuramoyl-L-alanine amidase family protein [Defluviitaleaceae bacterium]|nr:N-acetylmuramoyl-L-alanine amidase family protein [Defluviitaleaceae bacterium]
MQKLIKSVVPAAMFLTIVVAGFFGTEQVLANASDSSPISLVVENTLLIDLESPPVIYNDFTLVPARDVFENLGADVGWIPPTQEIIVSYEDNVVAMQIDSLYANVGGSLVTMSIPPRIINGRTMIPLRFVSESFGFDVQWDGQRRVAYVARSERDLLHAPGINIPPSLLPGYEQVQESRPENGHGQQYFEYEEDAEATTPRDISPFAITAESHPRTTLVSVEEASANVFLEMVSYGITASGPISRVDTLFLYGNRVVLDIHNAASSLPSVTETTSPFVRQVRSSSAGSNVERVVFDLHAPFDVAVTMSEDRRSMFLSFTMNSVTDIRMAADGNADTVTINLDGVPNPSTFFLADPRRLVIDQPGSLMDTLIDDAQSGQFVSHIRSSQYSPTSGRVVLTFHGEVSVQTSVVGNSLIVTATAPTFRNISYDAASRTIVISKAGMHINSGAVTHDDEYLRLRYTLHMGYNLLSHLGYGTFPIYDDFINSVNIQTNAAGQTSLVISQRRILAFVVEEDTENIYIRARLPREVHSHIVVVDPGHGGSDPGAYYGGVAEKDLNLQIAERLIANIRQSGYIKVYTTRYEDVFVTLGERARLANEVGDLFVSIHNNAVRRGGNTAANGTETHYWTRPNANPDSIGSREAAEIFHRTIIGMIGSNDREVRQSQFVVLSQTTMPAVFLEIGFMSNPAELQRLTDTAHQQLIADAIYASIREVFSIYAPRR